MDCFNSLNSCRVNTGIPVGQTYLSDQNADHNQYKCVCVSVSVYAVNIKKNSIIYHDHVRTYLRTRHVLRSAVCIYMYVNYHTKNDAASRHALARAPAHHYNNALHICVCVFSQCSSCRM